MGTTYIGILFISRIGRCFLYGPCVCVCACGGNTWRAGHSWHKCLLVCEAEWRCTLVSGKPHHPDTLGKKNLSVLSVYIREAPRLDLICGAKAFCHISFQTFLWIDEFCHWIRCQNALGWESQYDVKVFRSYGGRAMEYRKGYLPWWKKPMV